MNTGRETTAGREPVVSFEDVSYRSADFDAPLLENLSARIGEGESLVLAGPAHNGKSTALAMVMGGAWPSSGEVRVLGLRPRLLPEDQLDELRSRIGYVPQQGGLLSNLSLIDNVSLPLRYHRDPSDDEVRAALERVQRLLGVRELPTIPAALAPLRLRRVAAIARALILEPRLLVLDEPARGLAGWEKRELWGLLAAVQAALGVAVLAATSDSETAYLLGGQVQSLPARHSEEDAGVGTGIWRAKA
jgi:phospholipid/cholesterol/gamma-HCH transport system ATP-binding protein